MSEHKSVKVQLVTVKPFFGHSSFSLLCEGGIRLIVAPFFKDGSPNETFKQVLADKPRGGDSIFISPRVVKVEGELKQNEFGELENDPTTERIYWNYEGKVESNPDHDIYAQFEILNKKGKK